MHLLTGGFGPARTVRRDAWQTHFEHLAVVISGAGQRRPGQAQTGVRRDWRFRDSGQVAGRASRCVSSGLKHSDLPRLSSCLLLFRALRQCSARHTLACFSASPRLWRVWRVRAGSPFSHLLPRPTPDSHARHQASWRSAPESVLHRLHTRARVAGVVCHHVCTPSRVCGPVWRFPALPGSL